MTVGATHRVRRCSSESLEQPAECGTRDGTWTPLRGSAHTAAWPIGSELSPWRLSSRGRVRGDRESKTVGVAQSKYTRAPWRVGGLGFENAASSFDAHRKSVCVLARRDL